MTFLMRSSRRRGRHSSPPVVSAGLENMNTKWAGNAALHLGSRMDDETDLISETTSSGFSFDGLPYHEIVDNDHLQINAPIGGQAIPLGAQVRWRFSALGPANAECCTVAWQAKYDPTGYYGGKAYQLADASYRINCEMTPLIYTDPDGVKIQIPQTRVYPDEQSITIGGNGASDVLSSNPWASRNVEPALDAPGRNYTYQYSKDHITGTSPRAFVIRDSQWTRFIYTRDWRTSPYRIWLWMEAEDTERTLLVADETTAPDFNAGFILDYNDPVRDQVAEFWAEFNNSTATNDFAFWVKMKDLVVLKNVLGGDI